MLQESPDASENSRLRFAKVFGWGALVTGILVGLIFLYVPPAPERTEKTVALSQYEGLPGTGASPAPDNSGAQGPEIASPVAASSAAQAAGTRTPEQIYLAYCAQCHGKQGDGDAPLARMMSVKPTHLVNGPFRFGRTPEAVAQLVRQGIGAMPGFREEISEDEALRLAEFVLKLAEQK